MKSILKIKLKDEENNFAKIIIDSNVFKSWINLTWPQPQIKFIWAHSQIKIKEK